METRMAKRLQKDYDQMKKNYLDTFTVKLVNDNIRHWIVTFKAAQGTIYDGEQFDLQLKFSPEYVIFIGKPPVHEHIYSNGFICLSILFDGTTLKLLNQTYLEWSAALTVSSICLSILSMLSSALKKVKKTLISISQSKPPNDTEFVKRAAGRGPKNFIWSFDDEKV